MKLRAVAFDIYHTLFEVGPPPADADERWEALWKDALADPPRLTLDEFAVECDKIIRREHAAARRVGVLYPEIYWPAVAKEALPELARLGETERDEVLVPDSSHGTNPATATMAGCRTITIPSAADGGVDIEAFKAALGPRTAAVMITNPSTLGLFERRIADLLEEVHAAGALAYMDGANLNAILGRFKPGEAGFDVMHFNVHKTFSTPHGGGGPGAGPVGVGDKLLPFLPSPRVLKAADGSFRLERPHERPSSIGRLRSFVGNTGVLVRAYAYLRAHGGSGLRQVSDDAVLAANYLKHRVGAAYEIPYDRPCKHEFVASAAAIKRKTGVRTLDIAKRLIDHGFHPPTIYFPLIVEEGMLIEPTETESVETLDAFADALIAIAAEAETDPETIRSAPHTSPVRRLDEALAARHPNLRWRGMSGSETPCPD